MAPRSPTSQPKPIRSEIPTAGVMMDETHIFLDESGFTGQDLLNLHEPIFCIAATTLDEATAGVYHAELLKHSNARR